VQGLHGLTGARVKAWETKHGMRIQTHQGTPSLLRQGTRQHRIIIGDIQSVVVEAAPHVKSYATDLMDDKPPILRKVEMKVHEAHLFVSGLPTCASFLIFVLSHWHKHFVSRPQ
jgi:hypothetical protein